MRKKDDTFKVVFPPLTTRYFFLNFPVFAVVVVSQILPGIMRPKNLRKMRHNFKFTNISNLLLISVFQKWIITRNLSWVVFTIYFFFRCKMRYFDVKIDTTKVEKFSKNIIKNMFFIESHNLVKLFLNFGGSWFNEYFFENTSTLGNVTRFKIRISPEIVACHEDYRHSSDSFGCTSGRIWERTCKIRKLRKKISLWKY